MSTAGEMRNAQWGAWRLTLLGLLGFAALLVAIAGKLWLDSRSRIGEGQMAADFTLRTFDETWLNTQELRENGKPILVNFWGSWCPPCHQEAPALQKLWKRFRSRGVQFIGVAYLDTEHDALNYIERYAIDYPNGLDIAQVISNSYQVRAVPESFLVAPSGHILYFHSGPIDERRLSQEIENSLADFAG